MQTDSIVWVRCASGNVSLMNLVFRMTSFNGVSKQCLPNTDAILIVTQEFHKHVN